MHAGGRLTAHDVHYVAAADGSGTLMPAAETEFAKDRAFGYSASSLPAYVEEKTGGAVRAGDVLSLSLDLIRSGGPAAVADALRALPNGGAKATIISNALVPSDMAVVALGCMQAERSGALAHGLLYRSAGALVAARAAIPPRPLLTAPELQRLPANAPTAAPGAAATETAPIATIAQTAGLLVVGSYVGKSSAQLAALRELCPWVRAVELKVSEVAKGGAAWDAEEARARAAVEDALQEDRSVVLYTSRELVQDDGSGGLAIGQRVTDALTALVRRLAIFPSFLVAKGGITSNDVAVHSLGIQRAEVLGCIRPGVPVWRCGPESAAPGLAYVVFPGNVGAAEDLARVASIMSGRGDLDASPLDAKLAASSALPADAAAVDVEQMRREVLGAAAASAASAASITPASVVGGASVQSPLSIPMLLREARDASRAVGAFNV